MKSTKIFDVPYKQAEKPIDGAPVMVVDDGHGCIPQHFLQYDHSYESVAAILHDIEFDDKYPLFVSEDESGLYVQVGIIGYDNYKKPNLGTARHIVYGRKWRVERNLPSSEVIQTVFLALKKAREHEIRELLRLKSVKSAKFSTPFSGHHDTPFLAETLAGRENCEGLACIEAALARLRFDGLKIALITVERLRNGKMMLDLKIADGKTRPSDVPEFHGLEFTVLLDILDENALYHGVMDALIAQSDRYVEEHFEYRGFARFSRTVDIAEIGEISISLRDQDAILQQPDFAGTFKSTNFQVDATRVPTLKHAPHIEKTLEQLKSFGELHGHLPRQVEADERAR